MKQKDVEKLLDIGVQLSSQRDLNRLLEHILSCVMELSRCDAGTLYLLEDGALHFRIMRNDTLKTYSGGDGQIPGLPPVPLTRESVCALAALDDKTILVDDVYHCREYDLTGPVRYDAMTGYHTQSMLVVPMRNREGEIIGVLQLINAMDEAGRVCPFSQEMCLVLESLASQAAITVQNVRYVEEIRELFRSFVRAMSAAVDQRSRYTGNHSRNMVKYGGRFLDFLSARAAEEGHPEPFPPARREEFLMSVWLHDIGKLSIPLEIMDKPERLLPEQKAAIGHRLEVIRLLGKIQHLNGQAAAEDYAALEAHIRQAAQTIQTINAAGFVTDQLLEELEALRSLRYIDEAGQEQPWLTDEECAMLSIRRGTLSDQERAQMQEHVVITKKLLSQIRFSKDLANVPLWAGSHHELLNGAGYPDHLSGDQIPFETRILTILDIFDALVADDRPYKKAKTPEQAIDILTGDAEKAGKLDIQLVRLFIESRCWES